MDENPSATDRSDISKGPSSAWEGLRLSTNLPFNGLFRSIWGVDGPSTGYESLDALNRATELFLKQVSFKDYTQLKETGYISVTGVNYEYRIYPKVSWNISFLTDGVLVGWLDSRFEDRTIPLLDQLTSQYIMLKTEEVRYVKNQCWVREI